MKTPRSSRRGPRSRWADVAITGEISLRREVLPNGGLKEKLLAAHRCGITTLLIPSENEKDLAEIPDNIKDKLEIRAVKWIEEVLEIALERSPLPMSDPARASARDPDGAPATTPPARPGARRLLRRALRRDGYRAVRSQRDDL